MPETALSSGIKNSGRPLDSGWVVQRLGWGRGRPLLCACLQFSAILFAVFFGWLFFDEKLESFATVGIVIIIAAELAAAVIGLRSRARRGSSA